jgi:putative pyruvate formate lyase activating enzyme
MLHKWEEPCLVGEMGAGTIFFSGCNLGCVYCQNSKISRGACGEVMSESELERAIFSLEEQGAACVELVTPTHYTDRLASLLSRVKHKIDLPVVWNSGGYEKAESLRLLDGLIDIYMPDFKYFSPDIAKKYSYAPNYREYALSSLSECVRQTGAPKFKGNGMMERGVIVRHLILPSHRADSVAILELVASEIGAKNVILSLMGQYTPDFYAEGAKKDGKDAEYKNLCRRITSFEYNSVLSVADRLGFEGYFQDLSSASREYTPDF